MRLNLKRKYTFFIVSLILFVVIVFFAFSYTQFNRMSSSHKDSSSRLLTEALSEEMEKKGIVISQLLAENLINPLYNYDQNAIQNLLAGFKSYHDVLGVYVYDSEGKVIHDGTKSVEKYGAFLEDRGSAARIFADLEPVVLRYDDYIEVFHPVSLDQTVLGGIKVVLSLSDINHQIAVMETRLSDTNQSARESAYRYLLITALLILLAGVILSYTLASRISVPIKEIADYAASVGRGNYKNRIEYKAKDEIGELVDAFNNMQSALMQSTVSIHELGKLVDARTRELAAANDDLKLHQEQLELKVAERTVELLETNKCLTREIEERKAVQQKLIRAKKMEAIGTLAAGVAHDLNNILTGMVGIPDLILMNRPKEDPLVGDLLTIKKSGLRAAAVVQDLLNLARKTVVHNKAMEFRAVIQEYLDSPEHKNLLQSFPGVAIHLDIPAEDFMIMGSQIHLAKALMNLINNAAEAMPAGGPIVISLNKQFIDPSGGEHKELKKGDYVLLQVKDTGDGIAADKLDHIFEPFYTTKTMGRSGSGLGLTVVWETVKDHNGNIEVRSELGKGTVFTLFFPAAKAVAANIPEKAASDDYHGRGETVLVVDDLESQRALLTDILNRLGYKAQSSASGEDAVEYLKHNSADLLVLDMIMPPGMDGLDTYRQIIQFRPGQKAIIASGYSETARVRQLQELGVGAYIRKPYTVKQIGRTVRAELDRQPCVLN
ncbi:MAG: response regulator [Acidobacteria bacterium]|nr:response regulator [Acidobacteriota bacterium]